MSLENYREIYALRRLNFDDETTRKYFLARPPQAGDSLIIYMGQGHMNRYELGRVADVHLTKLGNPSKIYLEKAGSMGGGSAFYISGKNLKEPTGQTKLLPLVDSVARLLTDRRYVILEDDQLRDLLAQ